MQLISKWAAAGMLALGCSSYPGASVAWLAAGGPAASCTGGEQPPELVLERALPIAVEGDFEPSGLALLPDGRLLTVSDKHDAAVYQLELGNDVAIVRPFLRIVPPWHGPTPTDFEGLALDTDGAFLLASEGRAQILRLEPGGGSTWITGSLERMGRPFGLLGKLNAGIEGVVRLPHGGGLLIAAEREPRGLIELPAVPVGARDDEGWSRGARAWVLPPAKCPPPPGRGDDLADLTVWQGNVYGLERNAHLVSRLERDATTWVEREVWSYARTENDPRYAYENRAFGLAEGLALDANHVFLVLDNNHNRRAQTQNGQAGTQKEPDRRPLLFVFRRPGS